MTYLDYLDLSILISVKFAMSLCVIVGCWWVIFKLIDSILKYTRTFEIFLKAMRKIREDER